jgi:hypothetical protein
LRVPADIEEAFLSGQRTAKTRFAVNDGVRVLEAEGPNTLGSVVAIVELNPEPIYLVELASAPYGDLKVSESALEKVEQ